MRQLLIVGLFLIITSCGAIYTVDYDTEKDFQDYNSYQFYPDIESGLSQLEDKRIMVAIDSAFQKRGYMKTDYCRFYVNFYASENVADSRNSIGIGVGGGSRNVGVGVSGGIPIGGTVINQQLTIDIIDASHGQSLAWQVVIDGEFKERATPEQREAYYLTVIEKALRKFPPKK